MKTICPIALWSLLLFLMTPSKSLAQKSADTLFLTGKGKSFITGLIVEIHPENLVYRRSNMLYGPNFTMPLYLIRQVYIPNGYLWTWQEDEGKWNDSLLANNFVREGAYLARTLSGPEAAACFFEKPPVTYDQDIDSFDICQLLEQFKVSNTLEYNEILNLLGPYAKTVRRVTPIESPEKERFSLKEVYELLQEAILKDTTRHSGDTSFMAILRREFQLFSDFNRPYNTNIELETKGIQGYVKMLDFLDENLSLYFKEELIEHKGAWSFEKEDNQKKPAFGFNNNYFVGYLATGAGILPPQQSSHKTQALPYPNYSAGVGYVVQSSGRSFLSFQLHTCLSGRNTRLNYSKETTYPFVFEGQQTELMVQDFSSYRDLITLHFWDFGAQLSAVHTLNSKYRIHYGMGLTLSRFLAGEQVTRVSFDRNTNAFNTKGNEFYLNRVISNFQESEENNNSSNLNISRWTAFMQATLGLENEHENLWFFQLEFNRTNLLMQNSQTLGSGLFLGGLDSFVFRLGYRVRLSSVK